MGHNDGPVKMDTPYIMKLITIGLKINWYR